MSSFVLGGEIEVSVSREGQDPFIDKISGAEFSSEEGSGFVTDKDGDRSYGGIFKAFRDDYTVELVVQFSENSNDEWTLRTTDVAVSSAVIQVDRDNDDGLRYELSYGDADDQ
ncbi:MAG TPA: hypothetical protein VIO38_11730 [Rariglobus sp.]